MVNGNVEDVHSANQVTIPRSSTFWANENTMDVTFSRIGLTIRLLDIDSTMTTDAQCPACGSPLPKKNSGSSAAKAVDDSLPASDVTIDIKAEDVDP